MKINEKMISKTQFIFIIIQAQIGVGLLSLPYVVHKHAKSDGWISCIVAGIEIFIFLLIMWALGKRFPNDTIYDYTKKILGKYLGVCISILYVIFFFIVSIFVVVITISVLKKWILTLTPAYVLVIFIVGTGVYLGRENLKVIGRFFTFVSVLILVLIFFQILSFPNLKFKYLFPIGHSGIKNILLGSHDALVAMLGFEVVLVIFPFVKATQKELLKSASISISFVSILYAFFLIVSYMSFSPVEIEIVPEPILYLLKALSYQVIERLDLIFLSIWVVPIITSFVTYLYLTSFGISKLLNLKNHKKATFFIGLGIAIISCFLPEEGLFLAQFGKYISYISYLFIGVIPFLLLIISIIRKKKEMDNLYEV